MIVINNKKCAEKAAQIGKYAQIGTEIGAEKGEYV